MATEIQEIKFEDLVFNPAVSARATAPDQDKVLHLAENFIERRSSSQPHQIQAGVVRMIAGKKGRPKYEVIVGTHRAYACDMATKAASDTYLFSAVVVESEDENALIDAIQENEYRVATNIFDRADSVERLIKMGKSQVECATIFGLSEGSISQTRKAGKLEPKYRKAVENGDLETDAAILIAGLETDETTKTEIFEESVRHKARYASIEATLENRRAKAAAQAKIDTAKEAVEKSKELAKAKESERKALDKSVKEIRDTITKTTTVEEKVAVTEQAAAKEKEAREVEVQAKKLQLETDKALKALEKAKADKEKLKEALAKKAPVTQEEVKAAAKGKGVTKNADDVMPKLTGKKIEAGLEIIANGELAVDKDGKEIPGKYKVEPLGQAASALIGKLQAFISQDITDTALRAAFVRFCKSDEELAASKGGNGKAKGAKA